jgi:His-Xaa-Ser system protein HxsD
MSELVGMPSDQVAADVSRHAVTVTVDESIYPLDAIYGASYTFLDRCYVLLDRASATHVRIRLSPKKASREDELRDWAGELLNELLSCAWRAQIVRENRAVIEAVTLQAVTGAMGPPTLDELQDFDFAEEPFEDPLGIGLSWEEKYKKKGGDAPTTVEAQAAPAGSDDGGAA